MKKEDKEKAIEWYTKKQPFYEQLALKLEDDIVNILEATNLEYYNIESRSKSIESFTNKIDRFPTMNYEKIQDLAGVRIIAYVKSDLSKIEKVIGENFVVDKKRSKDKAEILGTDKVGYQSIHYIAKYSPERIQLTEYRQFENIEFEIQMRTILQHAWAEIEHDRNYKFSGILPKEIQRQLNLLAGSLELTDNQFQQISIMIDDYKKDVSSRTKRGDLAIPINSTSLKQYLDEKYSDVDSIRKNFHEDDRSDDLISELNKMNVKTLKDLDTITKPNFKEKLIQFKAGGNYLGLIRSILMIHDPDKYFSEAIQSHWSAFDVDIDTLLKEYGLDVEALSEKYKISIPSSHQT